MSQKHCPSWSSCRLDLRPGGNRSGSRKAKKRSASLLHRYIQNIPIGQGASTMDSALNTIVLVLAKHQSMVYLDMVLSKDMAAHPKQWLTSLESNYSCSSCSLQDIHVELLLHPEHHLGCRTETVSLPSCFVICKAHETVKPYCCPVCFQHL